MKSLISSLIGLALSVSVGAESLLEGRVQLSSGQPAIGVQVRLFDLTDLRRFVGTTTDGTGHFALPLREFSMARGTALPTDFALGQNYPNPFNPSTIIPYQLPSAGHVRLEVFNMLGQRLATLVDAERSAGAHIAQWDATDAAGQAVGAGVYIYRLSSGGISLSRRMVLVDGQAGVPAAGASPEEVRSAVEGFVEADGPVYGLTVSGKGLVAYVNPAFRVGVDEADLVIEEHGGIPRMKLAAGGILGDVDGNGQVDVFDVLYVLLYSEDSSVVLPNNGDISRGDVNGDGRVDITDAVLLLRYSSNPSDPTLPGIGDETGDDHGNTRSEATQVSLGSSASGSLSENDVDYFVIEMPSAGVLVATTTSSMDTYGSILDVDGNILAEDDDRGGLLNFRVSADLGAGTYYIQVKASEIALGSTVGDYTLQVTDIRSGANRVPLGGAIGGLISGLDDVDYFVIELPSAGVLEATTTGSTDTYGILLDESGNPLAGDDDSGEDLNFLLSTSVDTGIYYLRVGGFTSGNYTLFVHLDAPVDPVAVARPTKIYWTGWDTGKIQRANLDGSNVEDLVTGLHLVGTLALDMASGKMYWIDLGPGKIQRANLDGSNVEDLVTGLESPIGLALDIAGGKMYWTDRDLDKIQRANLDGSNVEDLITTGILHPLWLALDIAGGKMYWTDLLTGKIQRANLDGSNVEDLVTGLVPIGLALDIAGGKMYWTWSSLSTGKIQRANLDGSNVEDLVTGLGGPIGLALDIAGGKMYWTDWTTDKIQRANLDGSNVEDLVIGLVGLQDIALGGS